MAQQRPYPITLDERQLPTQLSRSQRVPRTAGTGHKDAFPPTRLSAGSGFRKETIAGRNGRDASIPALSRSRRTGRFDPTVIQIEARRLDLSRRFALTGKDANSGSDACAAGRTPWRQRARVSVQFNIQFDARPGTG
jgi:hypothetical protein